MTDDRKFMRDAYEFAMTHATDPSTQNGAVLVDFSKDSEGVIVARGANHLPSGVVDLKERWERPQKYRWVEHAERNVIFDAARRGVATSGLTMYVPWFACADCARAIIQSGVSDVVGHELAEETLSEIEKPNGTWDESIQIGMQMLQEAGIRCRYFKGKLDSLGGITVRRNGQKIEP